MRSLFRYSLLGFCAAVLVVGVVLLSSPRLERKVHASIQSPSKIRISQFRENGPGTTGSCGVTAYSSAGTPATAFCNGRKDEFIEIYNATEANYTVGTTDPTNAGGIAVFASAGNGTIDNVVTMVCQIPNGTVIPPRGHVLCTNRAISVGAPTAFAPGANSPGYSLSKLGDVGSTTSANQPGSGGLGVVPGPIASGGGGSVANFPIVNGNPGGGRPGAFSDVDIPNDAGLLLANVGDNTVVNTGDATNGSDGFSATGVLPADFIVFDRVGFAPYGPGAPFQPTAGLNAQDPFFFNSAGINFCQLSSGNCGPSGNTRPSLASAFCDGNTNPANAADATCLRPVGDASTTVRGSQTFYGDSGQYALLRRQTLFESGQTIPRDTDNNVDDFIMVAPRTGNNIAINVTAFPTGVTNGLVSVLGAAFPHNKSAPRDAIDPDMLAGALFDTAVGQLAGPNAERRWAIDNSFGGGQDFNSTITNNNKLGSLILRFKFTMNIANPLHYLRFSIDNLPVPCGAVPGTATPGATVGSGNARNLNQTAPNCQGSDSFTAVVNLLNMPTETVAQSGGALKVVRGSAIEDLSAPNPIGTPPGTAGTAMAPNGGGINNKLVRTTSPMGSINGEFFDIGTGLSSGSATPSETNGGVFFMAFRFGVYKSGGARFLIMPEGTPATPVVPLVVNPTSP